MSSYNNSSSNNKTAASLMEMGTTVETKAQPHSPAMAAHPQCNHLALKRALPGRSCQGPPPRVLQRMCFSDPLLHLHLALPLSLSPHKSSHQAPLAPGRPPHGILTQRWLELQDHQHSVQMHVADCLLNRVNLPTPSWSSKTKGALLQRMSLLVLLHL